MGSETKFNFDENATNMFCKSTFVDSSSETTVAHELSHQYDYEIGNMSDSSNERSNENIVPPTEIRAVENENIARKKLNMETRKYYGGTKVIKE